MTSRNTPGPSVTSPLVRSPDSHGYPQLSPSTSTLSRPNGLSSRNSRTASSFSSFIETPTRNGPSLPRSSYTPNPNLRHIAPSSIPASSSGGATPDYKRRAKRMAERGLIKEGEKDWGNVEPDEVFRRLPVTEVRRVEGKMRKEALDKQSDLRAMVGTRYRDLLTSATQISTLRTASLHLSDSLRTVAAACANADDIAITAETSTQGSDSEDVMAILPIAAHMKLLLDAPEALYAYLGEGEVLRAGWLWLVARVVKEGITSMGEASEIYQPLLAKQWELLVPFRAQIVQKATEKLRSKVKIDTRTLAETLLAIILLDNLPISETLSLLLTQRTLALRDILAHPTTVRPVGSSSNRKGKETAPVEPPTSAMERESIGAVLGTAVECLLDTSELATQVFAKRSDKANESLLEELIRLVQQGEVNPPTITQHKTPLRRNSSSTHHRRASRLVSISLPFTDPTSHTNPDSSPPITTLRIIQSLPSSQILLRHLPSSITGFTPFITPPQSPDLAERLEKWQLDGVGILGNAAPAWLADLHTAQAVWGVRAILAGKLGTGEFEVKIEKALEDQWGARARGIWTAGTDGLVSTVRSEVERAVQEIQTKAAESDINPEKHVFSTTTFPSIPSATLNIPNPISFPTFMSSLKKRNVYRTPLLDRVLIILEDSAKELSADVTGLPESLGKAYMAQVQIGLEGILGVLRSLLEGLSQAGEEAQEGSAPVARDKVYAELFIGRLALFLVRQSPFLETLTGSPVNESDPIPTALLALHSTSTTTWRTQSTTSALSHLSPLFSPHRGPREVSATWQGPHPISPSAPIIVALHSLVKAVRHLGIPPMGSTGLDREIPVVRRLVEEFVDTARALEGWGGMEGESCIQAAVDLGFLCLVRGGVVDEDEGVKGMLEKIPESHKSTFPQLLSPILAESIRRVQLILHPLLTHLQPTLSQHLSLPTPTAPKARNGDTRSQLLRFGPPSGRIVPIGSGGDGEGQAAVTTTTEFRSPIAVAKPGKRFGLVSIAS